ncbi:MAG TPA: outer membrane beta-barrel protein [Bryobacteraceae bacterium]|nr:outer membrane beta-barrel protein [Bryobacteraceae bacterium]
MSSRTLVSIVVAACSPLLAFAESGFSLGPDAKLHLTLDGQVRYDDNINLAEKDTEDDVILVAIPGIQLNYEGGQSTGQLVVLEQFNQYCDHSTLDGELFSAVGDYKYDGALTDFDAHASYREQDQGNAGMRNREEAVRHDLASLSANAIWTATQKTRIGAGASYDAITYPGARLADSETVALPVDFYYAITPKVDISIGYRYRTANLDSLPTIVAGKMVYIDNDWDGHFFNIGATGEFTPKLKGKVRLGYNKRKYDRGGSQGEPGLMAGLTYAYSPKASYDLTASNDYSNSIWGTGQKVFSIRGSGRYEFTPQWSTQYGIGFESTRYDKPLGSTYSNNRKDDFLVADITVVYAMNENVSLLGTYVYRENFSNRAGEDFRSNLLILGASLRY